MRLPNLTDDQVAQIERMWRDGSTAPQIGDAVGRSKSTVDSVIDRLQIRRRLVPREPFTDEEIAAVARMWADGKTSTQIAAALGRTKNAVCGRIHRMKLPARHGGRINSRLAGHVPQEEPLMRDDLPILLQLPRRSNRAYLFRLTGDTAWQPKECQFINGDPRERDFCGDPVAPGSPYCPKHHSVCHKRDAVAA